MKTIQIRNVPDDVHRALRTRAAAAGVSLSALALEELTAAVVAQPVGDVANRPNPSGTMEALLRCDALLDPVSGQVIRLELRAPLDDS